MPTMLDYERLVRENADLRVEIEKRYHNYEAHDTRWREISVAKVTATEAEIRRLQSIIKGWEERYDILAGLFMNQKHYSPPSGNLWLRTLWEKAVAGYKFWKDFTARQWNGQ